MATTYLDLSSRAQKLRKRREFADLQSGTTTIASFISELKAFVDNESVPPGKGVALRQVYLDVAEEYLSTGNVDVANVLIRSGKANLSQHEIRPVLARVNEDLVIENGHEITAHGLIRSFRFWSEAERRDYLSLANEMLAVIRQKFPDALFGYGFALSMVRDGDLMPHDDDVDIIVAADSRDYATITDALVDLSLFLARQGMVLYGAYPGHRKVSKAGGTVDIDVFVGLREGDHLTFIPGKRKNLLYDRVFPASSREFLGIDCPLPADPIAYLSAVYGEDWRDPKPNWHHNWSLDQHVDILRKTLPGYPFQASALIKKGYEWVVTDTNRSLLSVSHEQPHGEPGALELRWILMQERLGGLV